jgi:peptide/nickel transport system permease protein
MSTIITILALDIPHLFGGAIVFETIFSWPGVGRLMYDAIMNKDFNLALCALVMISTLTVLASLLADISYALVDPRIEYK